MTIAEPIAARAAMSSAMRTILLSLFLVGCGGTVNVINAGSSDAGPGEDAPAVVDATPPSDAASSPAWTAATKLTRNDALPGDGLGGVVAATDRAIFASSKARSADGKSINAVYVFERPGDYAFYRVGRLDLGAGEEVAAMAASGTTLLVSVRTPDPNQGPTPTRLDVYDRGPDRWALRGSMNAAACAIAFDGSVAAISSPGGAYRVLDAGPGAPSTWAEEQAGSASVPSNSNVTCPKLAATARRVVVGGLNEVTVLDKGAQGWDKASFAPPPGRFPSPAVVALAGHDAIAVVPTDYGPKTSVFLFTQDAGGTFSSAAIPVPLECVNGGCSLVADDARIVVGSFGVTKVLRPGGGWHVDQELDGGENASLALAGPILARGEAGNGAAAEAAGAVNAFFERTFIAPTFELDIGAPLTASDAASVGNFGFDDDAGSHWAYRRDFGVSAAVFQDGRVAIADQQAVRMYARSGSAWSETGELLAIPEQSQIRAMAVSSDVVAAAAGLEGPDTAVLMFTRGADGRWSAPTPLPIDFNDWHTKGAALALDGTTLLEAAPWVYSGAPPVTFLTFHERGADGAWTQTARFDIQESDDAVERYPRIFAMNGGHALVSPIVALTIGVYERDASGWKAAGTLDASPLTRPETCAIAGDAAVCAGRDADHHPVMTLFAHGAGGWSRVSAQTLAPELDWDPYQYGYWGDYPRVAMCGDLVVVATGDRAGLFQRSGDALAQVKLFDPTDVGRSGGSFGAALALGEGLVVIGAPSEGTGGHTSAGAAYVFWR
jgi:hypothetical protein